MPALSAPNLALWRNSKPYSVRGYLFVLQPSIVFQAQINMASATYPLTSLTFDNVTEGAFGDIQPGQTLLLGSTPGAYDKGRTRVRDAASSGAIPIGRTPRGNKPGELDATDNAYITVVDLREVWAKIPFISETGVSLKDQTSFAANIAQPPIAHGGTAIAGFADPDTGTLEADFSAALSQVVDSSASSLTYSWQFLDGGTSTSETPTGIEFDPGFRYARLTVSDGTRSHSTYIPVAVLEREGENAPIPVEMAQRTLLPEGQSMAFTLKAANLPREDYLPGTLVIYFEEERFGMDTPQALVSDAVRGKVKFVGWLDTEPTQIQATGEGLQREVTLIAVDVASRLSKLPGFGQRVQNKTSPANWQQMKNANIDRYLHHLLHWHSTALEVAPFQWSGQGSSYPFTDLGSDGANLYSQVDDRARAIAHRLTCTQHGELRVEPDPNRQDILDRTTVEIVELTADDWSLVSYTTKPPSVHWMRGSAVVASNTQASAVFCIAPGASPGQGEVDREIGGQLVRNQSELNIRTGHDYARANAEIENFTIELTHGGDAGIEPAYMEWVTLGISATVAAQRGLTLPADTRFLVLEASIRYDNETGIRRTRLRVEPEVVGFQAETFIPKTTTQTPQPFPNYGYGPTYPAFPEDPAIVFPPILPIPGPLTNPMMPPAPDLTGNIVLIADSDEVWVLGAFRQAAIPSGREITPALASGWSVKRAIWGFGVDVYVLASNGSNSRVYYTEDALAGSPVWTAGEVVPVEFVEIRTTQTAGGIYVYGGSGSGCLDVLSPSSEDHPGTGISYNPTTEEYTCTSTGPYPSESSDHFVELELCSGGCYEFDYVSQSGWTQPNVGTVFTIRATNCNGTSYTPTNTAPAGLDGREIKDLFYFRSNTAFSVTFKLIETTSPVAPQTRYSADDGATFGSARTVGVAASGVAGIDTSKVGSQVLVASMLQTRKAEDGGAYAAYGDPSPQGAIVIPRYTFNSTTSGNTSDDPQYLLAAAALDDDDESTWRVTNSGVIFFPITPIHSTIPGIMVGANAVTMPWRSGSRMAGIWDFDGTRRLMTSANSGALWSHRGAMDDAAAYIRMRKGDTNLRELYIANGETALYSPDFGATLVTKTLPTSGNLVSIEVLG